MKNICGESVCRLCAAEVTNFVHIFQGEESKTPYKPSDVGSMMLDCLFSDVSAFFHSLETYFYYFALFSVSIFTVNTK